MSPRRRKGPTTLAEHDAQLRSEGQYEPMLERQRQRDAELEKHWAELDRAEAPLVADLRAAGYDVKETWQLMTMGVPYPNAIPILLEHLQRAYPGKIREWIARALGVKEALYAWATLKRLYAKEREPGSAKDGLASALCDLAKMSGTEHLDEVIDLVRDRRHGSSRLLLLSALEKSKEPRAWATLMDLGTDPDLILEIQHILKKRQRKQQGRRPPRTNE